MSCVIELTLKTQVRPLVLLSIQPFSMSVHIPMLEMKRSPMYLCVCMCVGTCISVFAYMCACVFIRVYVCIVCVCEWFYSCGHVCVRACVCSCACSRWSGQASCRGLFALRGAPKMDAAAILKYFLYMCYRSLARLRRAARQWQCTRDNIFHRYLSIELKDSLFLPFSVSRQPTGGHIVTSHHHHPTLPPSPTLSLPPTHFLHPSSPQSTLC